MIRKLGVVACLVEDDGGVGSRKEPLGRRLDLSGGASHALGVLGLGSLLKLGHSRLSSLDVLSSSVTQGWGVDRGGIEESACALLVDKK